MKSKLSINLYFENFDPLNIVVDDTETGKLYYQVQKEASEKYDAHFIDNASWTHDKLVELAKIAKSKLGWDWLHDNYTLDLTAQLHKDLEYSVGVHGFESVSKEHDWLLYELHHCLHSIQNGKNSKRTCHLQIEWLTDDFIPLPTSFKFSDNLNRGDVLLINPYVGHNPLQIYLENDYIDLNSTVKFHDKIKPGIVISSFDYQIDKNQILNAFLENDSEFVKKHTPEKILYYTGAAKIGKVTNIDQFENIMSSDAKLKFTQIEFN